MKAVLEKKGGGLVTIFKIGWKEEQGNYLESFCSSFERGEQSLNQFTTTSVNENGTEGKNIRNYKKYGFLAANLYFYVRLKKDFMKELIGLGGKRCKYKEKNVDAY